MDDRFALARKDPRYSEALNTPVKRPSILGPLFATAAMAGMGFVFYAITWSFGVMFWAGAALMLVLTVRSLGMPVRRELLIVDGNQTDSVGAGRSERVVHTVRFRRENGEFVSYVADGGLSMQEPGTIGVAATRGAALLSFDTLS